MFNDIVQFPNILNVNAIILVILVLSLLFFQIKENTGN